MQLKYIVKIDGRIRNRSDKTGSRLMQWVAMAGLTVCDMLKIIYHNDIT
jgi:hypothetical protein